MTDINRRAATLLALLSPLAASAARAEAPPPKPPAMPHDMDMTGYDPTVHWMGDEEIAMLVYPGMTIMDLVGPHCMFGSMMGAKIHLVAKTLEPVTSDTGLTILPTATFETCPRDLTVLFTPGGTNGTLAAASDPATLAFVTDRGSRAKYVTSVCSGSLILGAAGLLKGYRPRRIGRCAMCWPSTARSRPKRGWCATATGSPARGSRPASILVWPWSPSFAIRPTPSAAS